MKKWIVLAVVLGAALTVGLMTAGQSVGLVHDVPTVKELIDTIIGEAQQIVGSRLAGMTA